MINIFDTMFVQRDIYHLYLIWDINALRAVTSLSAQTTFERV